MKQARGREEKKQREDKSDKREDWGNQRGGPDVIIINDPFPFPYPWPGPTRWPSGRREYRYRLKPTLTFVRDGVGLCMMAESDKEPEILRRNVERGAQSPSRAPEKGRIAYVAPVNGVLSLFTVGENLTRPHRLTDPRWGDADLPAWSPEGGTLVFVSHRDGNNELYTVGSGGGSPKRLTKHSGNDTQPAWSPGGDWIIFVSDRGGKPTLWRVSTRGGEPIALNELPRGIPSDPSFSPDGRFLLACFEEEPGRRHLWKLDLSAKGPPQRLSTEPWDYKSPTFRPDGAKVALSVGAERGGYAIALLDLATGKLERLTSGALSDLHPSWW